MSTRAVTFRLPEETIECLRAQSQITGKSKTQLVIHAIHRAYELQSLPPLTSLHHASNGHHAANQPYENGSKPVLTEPFVAEPVLSEPVLSVPTAAQISPVEQLDGSMSRLIDALQQVVHSAKLMDASVLSTSALDEVIELHSANQGRGTSANHLKCLHQLDQVLAAIPNPIFLCDRQQRVSYLNPASARLWRSDRQAVLGSRYTDLGLPVGLASHYAQQFETVLTLGQATSVEIGVPSMGCTRYYLHHFYPIENKHDHIDGVIGIAHDITASKQIEDELRDSRENYRNLFEFANDMIFIVDVSSRIIEVNQCAARRLGYVRHDLEQQTLDDISTRSASEQWHKAIVTELERSGSAVFKHGLCRKTGEAIAVEISARLVEFSNQLAFQLLARDLS